MRNRLRQVLVNLINNAVDAVQNQEDRWVKIHVFEDRTEIVFQVIDSAPHRTRSN